MSEYVNFTRAAEYTCNNLAIFIVLGFVASGALFAVYGAIKDNSELHYTHMLIWLGIVGMMINSLSAIFEIFIRHYIFLCGIYLGIGFTCVFIFLLAIGQVFSIIRDVLLDRKTSK